MIRLLILSLLPCIALHAAETLRQPTTARIWLKVPASQSPLQDVRISTGTVSPASWEKDPAVRDRHTDLSFPVRWWDWREVTVSFTPVEDGTVDLGLLGPWEEEKPGAVFREDVLWDGITADGTRIQNGGFETQADGKPAAWTPSYGGYPAQDAWPLANPPALEGMRVAATWQNCPLSQTIPVTAGKKVTIRLHGRAATLPDFVAPKLLGQNTPAHRAAASIKRGVNLGNCWEAPPPYTWGIRYTPEDIDRIADAGFDHIRVPVAWHFYLKPGADGLQIDPALLTDLEPVLRRALDRKMKVLLNWHHFHDLTTDPAANKERFIAGWKTVTSHFKSWPPELFLELLNEPRDALTTEVANPLYADTIAAMRVIDPKRIIFVSPGRWGDPRELDKLRLPDGDDRIVVTVHCYEPFHFTHQGAGWVGLQTLRGVFYPGPPPSPLAVPEALREDGGIRDFVQAYNTLPSDRNPSSPVGLTDLLDLARDWSLHFGRPVHLGEFGCINTADPASRTRYAKDVRTLAEARKIPWAWWEWKAGFGYWDPEKNQPLLKPALFE